VKIYVAAAVEALRKKERQDDTQFTTKIDGFLQFHPSLNANVLFCRFFLNLTLCMTKLRVLVLCFFYITDNFSTLSALAQITLLLEMMKLSQKKKKKIFSQRIIFFEGIQRIIFNNQKNFIISK